MNNNFDAWMPTQLNKFDASFLNAFATKFANYPQKLNGKKTYAVLMALNLNADPNQVKSFTARFSDAINNHSQLCTLSEINGQRFVSADITFEDLGFIDTCHCVVDVQFCEPPQPNRNIVRGQTSPSKLADSPKSSAEKMAAVIDHGCPFAHIGFRNQKNPDQSRFVAIWDQDEHPDFPANVGTQPKHFKYGRQVDRLAINKFLADATNKVSKQVDEDLCYKFAEYEAVNSKVTHGSHTLGLFASHIWSPSLSASGHQSILEDQASLADIVFVQIPRHIPFAPDPASIERHCLDGLRYILDCAGEATKEISVVIDYGSDIGPHDGSELFVRAVDALIEQAQASGKSLKVVFPSGNSFQRELRAKASFPKDRKASLYWTTPIGNEVPSVTTIWLSDTETKCRLIITPPDHMRPYDVDINDTLTQDFGSYSVVIKKHESQRQIFIQTSPTNQSDFLNRPISPAGVWKLDFDVKLVNESQEIFVKPFNVIAYTAWGGKNSGFAQRVFEAKFLDNRQTDDSVGDFIVSGNGSIFSTACGNKSYAIGGYINQGDFKRSTYSAAGLVRGGKYSKSAERIFLAPADDGFYFEGLLSMGTRSGSWLRIHGTSVAAPQAARALLAMPKLIEDPKKKGPNFDGISEFGEMRLSYP